MAAMPRKHLDEARQDAVRLASELLDESPQIRRAVLVSDLGGRMSVVLWLADPAADTVAIGRAFADACGSYWTGTVIVAPGSVPEEGEDLLVRTAWDEGNPLTPSAKVRFNDRFRHHTAWRRSPVNTAPLWSPQDGPPIVVFHAFKGGVGRTTMLAGYALRCARRGEHVAVVDVDLDAPGIGALLAADAQGLTARWGTVDFLLESGETFPIEDYIHTCSAELVDGPGRIEVVPAGLLNDDYIPKLARADLETRGDVHTHPLAALLHALRRRGAHRILLDGRAGLSPSAGLLLSGLAHLHVLIATMNPQSLMGLERVVRHLGFDAARLGVPQKDCIVVQAMLPEASDASATVRVAFNSRVEQIFTAGYYPPHSSEDDANWSLDDLDNRVAPHVPVHVSYRATLSHYASIREIADVLLADTGHVALHERLDERLGVSEERERSDG